MKISDETLASCEPLFEGFLAQAEVEGVFRYDLFEAVRGESDLFSETLRVLNAYAADRCRAVYCLLVNGLVWDAEIVLRSFYETTAKSLFISTAPITSREMLLREFWQDLPAIYDVKGAERAKIAEKLARRHGSPDGERVFSFLRDPQNFNVEYSDNRHTRKVLEQKWSFSKIINTLNRGADGHTRINSIDALFHNYGMASHVAHASAKAFDLLEDRSLRGNDLHHLEAGHVVRMLSDMICLTAFTLHQAQVAVLGPMPMAQALRTAIDNMSEIAQPFQEAFDRSQDEFYADGA